MLVVLGNVVLLECKCFMGLYNLLELFLGFVYKLYKIFNNIIFGIWGWLIGCKVFFLDLNSFLI